MAIHSTEMLDSQDLLFRLTPSTSDMDIEHSGPQELNATVHNELVASVPAAASIRLEIRSEKDSTIYSDARRFQAFAPVLSMSLSSERFHDPDGGAIDIATGEYRFLRNPTYTQSPLYTTTPKRDLEIFSMLIFLKAILEDGVESPKNFLDELKQAEEIARLQEDKYLKARLLYLLAGIWAVSHLTGDSRQLIKDAGLEDLFGTIAGSTRASKAEKPSEVFADRRAIIVSSWLGGDGFRFPVFTPEPFIPANDPGSILHEYRCAPDQKCLLESPWLKVAQGLTACTIKQTSHGFEFVNLLFELPEDCMTLQEQDITACWVLKGKPRQGTKEEKANNTKDGEKEVSLNFPAPTVCHILKQEGRDKISVRSNLLDLGGLVTVFTDVKAKVVLLCAATE
jgi:hypothetical protein